MRSQKKKKSGANIYSVCSYSLPKYHEGKTCFVDFKCIDPVDGILKRKKYHLDGIASKRERRKKAAQIISSLKVKLEQGWNCWADEADDRRCALLENVLGQYKRTIDKQYNTGTLRTKSYQSYCCHLGVLTEWLRERPIKVVYSYQIDRVLAGDFLDYLYDVRDVSARTRNNYRGWLYMLCGWMVEKGYLDSNPVEGIRSMREEPKKRVALNHTQLQQLKEHLMENDRHFFLACMMEYYTFIRPIELTHLKVGDIRLKDHKIVVHAEWAKNRRDDAVGLNKHLADFMVELGVLDYPKDYYLFGSRQFMPSDKKQMPRIFCERFAKLRKALKWPDNLQFYSLKDTGIRDLANAVGIVVARDQARHTDVSTTNCYLKGDSATVHAETLDFEGEL